MLFTLGEALAVFLIDDGLAMSSASSYRRTLAGSEVNVAAGVVRLGSRARMASIVGDDGLGDAVDAEMSALGIDARIRRSPRPTGVIIRGFALAGPAESVHLRRGSAITDLSPDQVDEAWSDEIETVFVTGITAVRSASAQAAVERAVQLARERAVTVVVDPNYRSQLASEYEFGRALQGISGLVDVAIGDPGELSILAGTRPTDAVQALLERGCGVVVTKLGEKGVRATDGNVEILVPAKPTRVVDTVGAGDAFAAGFIASSTAGKSWPESVEGGLTSAARVVAIAGDIEPSVERPRRTEGTVAT